MTEVITGSISTADAYHVIQYLLDGYLSEKSESQADNDTHFTQYWESACRTIYEIAELLNVPIEDPWVDPSWFRTVEYETMLKNMKAEKRRSRKRQKEQAARAE